MQTEMVHNLSYVNGNLQEFISYLDTYYIAQKQGAVIATVNPEIGYGRGERQRLSSSHFFRGFRPAGWYRRRVNVTFDASTR